MKKTDLFYASKIIPADFDQTVMRVKDALKEYGFGVVSEINMQEKIKKGTGNDIEKYMILGACNPQGAYEALQIENHIGVLLPCNVIVRGLKEGNVEVAAVNPQKSMQAIGNPKMETLAARIGSQLDLVLKSL